MAACIIWCLIGLKEDLLSLFFDSNIFGSLKVMVFHPSGFQLLVSALRDPFKNLYHHPLPLPNKCHRMLWKLVGFHKTETFYVLLLIQNKVIFGFSWKIMLLLCG